MENETPFSYQELKSGSLQIFYSGKCIKTLAGKEAQKLISKLKMASADSEQLLLAKATGHFKQGNERTSKNAQR